MGRTLQAYKDHFSNIIEKRQAAHAYMFTGNDQAGKKELVNHIAQALTKAGSKGALDPELSERLMNRQTADIAYIQADGRFIRVEQIRQLKAWLATSPVELPYKLAVLEDADLLNASSANALLKVLEEPFSNVYLILLTTFADQVLPTIQSRVQEIYVQTEDVQDAVEALIEEGVTPPHAEILATLHADKPADYEEGAFVEELKAYQTFYSQLISREAAAFITVGTSLRSYLSVGGSLVACDYLLYLNYAFLRRIEAASKEQVGFQAYFLEQLLSRRPVQVDHLLLINDALYRAKERIMANVSPQVAFEGMALDIIY